MKLHKAKYRKALMNLGPKPPVFFDPPIRFRRWLEKKKIPTALIEFLVGNAIRDDLPFPNGCGGMWTPALIMTLNNQESALLDGGLLALGNAINGDFIVIDLEGTNQVGFVSHDELWESSPEDVREIFIPVDRSIHEMLDGISSELREWKARGRGTDLNYPIDYHAALEREEDE